MAGSKRDRRVRETPDRPLTSSTALVGRVRLSRILAAPHNPTSPSSTGRPVRLEAASFIAARIAGKASLGGRKAQAQHRKSQSGRIRIVWQQFRRDARIGMHQGHAQDFTGEGNFVGNGDQKRLRCRNDALIDLDAIDKNA